VENVIPERRIVAAVKVFHYDLNELVPGLKKGLDNIGGLNSMIHSGDKVFIKINHLSPPSPPEKGIVTHPVFTEAVIILLKETGADITVGDDIEEDGEDGFKISGYREMCRRHGVRLVNLRQAGFAEKTCDGKILKNIYTSKIVAEADVIINLPKLKTHSLAVFTGGIKNMYGIIPAGQRRRFHSDYLNPDEFAQMLVDIYLVVRPQLTIIDGVISMEGEGPGSGNIKNLGLILASRDGAALDAVAGGIIGLKPEDVLTTRYAGERGLGVCDLQNIDVVGEKFASLAATDFKLPAAGYRSAMKHIPHGIAKYILEQTSPRPRVKKKNCAACAKCVKACPTGAVTMDGKTSAINDKICIRCMCCHEVCRFNAIYIRRPVFGSVIWGIVRVFRGVSGR